MTNQKSHDATSKPGLDVMHIYGFWGKLNYESVCVTDVMRIYRQLTQDKG